MLKRRYSLQLSVEDLKRLFESDPRKLGIGNKADMVQELITMIYFDYTVETEVRLSCQEMLLGNKTMHGGFGNIAEMCGIPCSRAGRPVTDQCTRSESMSCRGYFLIAISMNLSASDWNCNQTLRLGQEMSTPLASDGGIRLKSHQYRDREPWTCLAARGDSDYDIHWEPKPTRPIRTPLERKSLSKTSDAPRSSHTTGKPSCNTGDDDPAATLSPFVKRELDVRREQKQGRQEAGVGNGSCIIGNRRRAGPGMETIGKPFAADDVAVHLVDSVYATVDQSDAAITPTLNDRKKSRSRLRHGLGNTGVINGGVMMPDERAVWVRQQLAISDAHNLVVHSTCKERGLKTADDADNIPFSSTKDGEQPIGPARDRAREAHVRGVHKNVPSAARRRREERGLAKGEKRSVASWPFEIHAVDRRTLPC